MPLSAPRDEADDYAPPWCPGLQPNQYIYELQWPRRTAALKQQRRKRSTVLKRRKKPGGRFNQDVELVCGLRTSRPNSPRSTGLDDRSGQQSSKDLLVARPRPKRKRPVPGGAPNSNRLAPQAATWGLTSRSLLELAIGITRGFIASGISRTRSTCRSPFASLAPLTWTWSAS